MAYSRKVYKLKDKKIKIWNVTETTDSMGQDIQTLSLVAEVWAHYRQLGGNEYYEIQKTNVKEDVVFTINYRTDVDAHTIITFNDKIYEVTRVDDYEGYKVDLAVYASWKKDQKASELIPPQTTPETPAEDPEENEEE